MPRAKRKRREREKPRLSRTDLWWLRAARRQFIEVGATGKGGVKLDPRQCLETAELFSTILAEIAEHRRFRKERSRRR